MMEDHSTRLLDFFKALGQKERLAIVGQLVLEPLGVLELSQRTGLKEMALLRHLSLLQETGLVSGSEERYWFDLDHLHALNRAIWSAVRPAPPAPESEDEAIVQRFVRNGRLFDLPVKESSLIVVLGWVAGQIPAERTFSEREISELLAEYLPDYAMLRRYLVDYNFLAREGGIYWRV